MNISALMHIALAGVLLCALSSAEAFTLDIFGNANMDDTIDENDVIFLQGIIDGTNNHTELADANYDGKIDEKDIEQIEHIIRGDEENLTIMQNIQPHTAAFATREPVTISMPIKSIAALGGTYGPEILCVLGDADKIVAIVEEGKKRGEFADYVKDAPEVGTTTEWDMEKIIEIKPDVVLAYAVYDYSSQRKVLNDAGIALVQMNFHVPETYNSEVTKLGLLLGKKGRADDLIDFEEKHLNFINERIKGLDEENKPRVYPESYKDLQYGPTSSVCRAVEPCGGINIFAGLNSTSSIDPEEVISKNPQVILKMTSNSFISQCGYDAANSTEMDAKLKEIAKRTGWDHIDAVKNGRIYIITSDAASIHPSIFNSYVAKWLHPELFEDMDPAAIHREWLQEFLGVDLKGVYSYPLLEES